MRLHSLLQGYFYFFTFHYYYYYIKLHFQSVDSMYTEWKVELSFQNGPQLLRGEGRTVEAMSGNRSYRWELPHFPLNFTRMRGISERLTRFELTVVWHLPTSPADNQVLIMSICFECYWTPDNTCCHLDGLHT
jgi:hypothetical protein